MRSISRSLALMALGAAWLSCPAASAALPKADEAFAGTGADYLNNAPRWTRESTGRVSFETSANRRRILNFRGTYYYYCGARTGSVTARYINVNSAGQFGYRFSIPNTAPDGQISGKLFIAIEGRFIGDGSTAKVSYLADYNEGKELANPFSTANPRALGCASWVRATVHAH